MKKATLIICFFYSCIATQSIAQNFNYHRDYDNILKKSKDVGDKLYYPNLLKRFNANDTTMTDFEVLAVMIGFTGQPNFKPYAYLDTERDIYHLNDEGKFKEAIAVCDTFIATHPLSQQALVEKSYAFHKLGQEDSSRVYMYRFHRIMEAMYWSREVESSTKITCFSMGPADGQNFIGKFLGAGIGTMGSGSDAFGNFCDILEAKITSEEGTRSVRYFFTIPHATKTMFDGLDFDNLLDEKPKNTKERKRRGN